VNDIEQLNLLDLKDQLKFARESKEKEVRRLNMRIKELQEEVSRLKLLLNGEDVIKNSLTSSKYTTPPFDKLKSSYRTKKKHK
tara:strand:- start:41 stop:289 length:249 start_codon:yes stop_codon:yes gene_type:complete